MANHTQKPNRLIYETSPYLLQHAYNPVEWFPWGEEALEKARKEDKPILVSIGYSACHWCHVMERESFESPEIAQVMNQHFVNIKIDREERPDLDQIYMEAVQLMGLNGGWPLNVFLLPDTVPFYGGTYFPPNNWKELLRRIRNTWEQARPQLEDSARSMAEALRRSELAMFNMPQPVRQFNEAQTDLMFDLLSQKFDPVKGGTNKSPKFPMPCIWEFLLRYAAVTGNGGALRQLTLTLDRIGAGGIYDQLGGGFARYSVDAEWFAPHFEKMLYDNGQLLSLYAHAFALTRKPRYANLLSQTIGWMERELLHPEGGFYSALDADSEGEEGRFYVWEWAELQAVLGADTEQVASWFNAIPEGNWEHGRNILHLNPKAADQQEPPAVATARPLLLEARAKRIRPGLDDKILASWNGWALKGLSEAAAATGNHAYLEMATRNAHFIRQNLFQHGRLWHTWKNGKAAHPAFLEDYAALIAGLTSLYQVGFDEQWLQWANQLTQYTISQFFDPQEHLFFFTDSDSEVLVTRKKEIFDNVIPASNSVMAWNLHLLGELMGNSSYTELSEQMVATVAPLFEREVQYLSNWASLYLAKSRPMLQIVITGSEYMSMAKALNQLALPGKIILAAETSSELPLFESRFLPEKRTAVFICQNRTCQLPAYSLEQAVEQLRQLGHRV